MNEEEWLKDYIDARCGEALETYHPSEIAGMLYELMNEYNELAKTWDDEE